MRFALIAASLVLFSAPAFARPVALAPVVFSPTFQEKLDETLGAGEADYLERRIQRALTRELTRTGGDIAANAPVTIETTLVDARANKPTLQQMADNTSLSYSGSISRGGAELVGILRGADGRELAQVSQRFYENDLRWASFTTWGDAERAIDFYARKMAAAYRDAGG